MHNPNFSRFLLTHPCDGQTDGGQLSLSA